MWETFLEWMSELFRYCWKHIINSWRDGRQSLLLGGSYRLAGQPEHCLGMAECCKASTQAGWRASGVEPERTCTITGKGQSRKEACWSHDICWKETGDSGPGKNTCSHIDMGWADGVQSTSSPHETDTTWGGSDGVHLPPRRLVVKASLLKHCSLIPTQLPLRAQIMPTNHTPLNTSSHKFMHWRWPVLSPQAETHPRTPVRSPTCARVLWLINQPGSQGEKCCHGARKIQSHLRNRQARQRQGLFLFFYFFKSSVNPKNEYGAPYLYECQTEHIQLFS